MSRNSGSKRSKLIINWSNIITLSTMTNKAGNAYHSISKYVCHKVIIRMTADRRMSRQNTGSAYIHQYQDELWCNIMKDEVYFYLQQHAAAIPKEGTHGHIGHVLGTFYLFFKNIIHSTKYYYSRISRAIANVLSDMSEVPGVGNCTHERRSRFRSILIDKIWKMLNCVPVL